MLAILLFSAPQAKYDAMKPEDKAQVHVYLHRTMQDLFPDCAVTRVYEVRENRKVNFYGECLKKKGGDRI